MNINRRKSKTIKIGRVSIGGYCPIAVQSMTNVPSSDFAAVLAQTRALVNAGCDIIRIAVPDISAAGVFSYLHDKGIAAPLVADVHFDYRIAVEAAAQGADKIRINPGNIGDHDHVRAVADACRAHNIPIRVGVNSGSLDRDILAKHGHVTAQALAESALGNVRELERCDFDNIVVAIKSSDVPTMIEANELISDRCEYPLHLGVTEAGTLERGMVKSAVGIGSLLTRGIGDTIRVSLTSDPTDEVAAAKHILEYCGLRENSGIEVVSCPTCGRTRIDLIGMAKEFERRAETEVTYDGKLKVAIMGCAVNGPGEAREADIGIAGGKGDALLFKKGEIVRKIDEKDAVSVLIAEINGMK